MTYVAGLSEFRNWIAFEHSGYARQKAMQWWSLHGGAMPFPVTVTEALERRGELACPDAIGVKPNGKFFDIVSYHFTKGKAHHGVQQEMVRAGNLRRRQV